MRATDSELREWLKLGRDAFNRIPPEAKRELARKNREEKRRPVRVQFDGFQWEVYPDA